jgi:hypothetical protein
MNGSGMTLITTVLLGAGAVLIASALDDSSIVETFQKIMRGETLSISAPGTTAATTSSTSTTPPPTYTM